MIIRPDFAAHVFQALKDIAHENLRLRLGINLIEAEDVGFVGGLFEAVILACLTPANADGGVIAGVRDATLLIRSHGGPSLAQIRCAHVELIVRVERAGKGVPRHCCHMANPRIVGRHVIA